jgi:hypothetical protein
MKKSLINWWLGGSNPLNGITALMDVWYDGTISSGQLIDKSGNSRHATVSSNLISNWDAVFGSTFIQQQGTIPTINTSENVSPPSGYTGQYYSNMQWTVPVASGIVRTESFILKAAETGFVDFFARRNTSSQVFVGLQPGNAGALIWQIDLSNASADAFLVSGSRTVGQWGRYRRSFTNVNPGGLADLRVQVLTGTHSVDFFIPPNENISSQDYGGVTITGQSNICFSLPNDSTLRSHDTKNNWYSATTTFPLMTRAADQYNAFVPKMYCGGAFRHVILKANPSINTHKILQYNFANPDYEFSSCPMTVTAGSGGTYATPQLALAALRDGTFRDRARILLLSDLTPSTYAEYTVTSAVGKTYIQMNKRYSYLDGGNFIRTITGTKEVTLSDSQLVGTELLATIYEGGVRNIKFVKSNGGYLWHADFVGMVNSSYSIVNCEFDENGANAVFDYRAANALPQPAQQLSFNSQAGGGWDNYFLRAWNTTFRGMRPYTWQDVATTSGNGIRCYYDKCVLDSEIIYDPVSNPTSSLFENVRLTSSGVGRNSTIYMTRATKNSTINEVGADKSIFLTEA